MRTLLTLSALTLCLSAKSTWAQNGAHKVYFVPGAHYSTPARAVASLTAFVDGRQGIVGKGYIATLDGGRDAFKTRLGIANVTSPHFGYAFQLSAMRTRSRPFAAMPNSTYAGTEAHVLITVVNLGVGFYAPVGNTNGRRGLLSLSAGLGF